MIAIPFNKITPYRNGKAGLIAGISQAIGLDQVFDAKLTQAMGRPPSIPYGAVAQMFLMSIADDHHPLSRLTEYFESIDLPALLNMPIDHEQLNDDRFGKFLDSMHVAGCSEILSAIAVKAFSNFGIQMGSMNYDTTSKIMWGDYKTTEGSIGTIEITCGHSKQHRPDKKQLKMAIGTTQGIPFDGQVLSGNTSDKTYNVDNVDRAVAARERFVSDGAPTFYVADSAAFTKGFFEKAATAKLPVITRMPDNILECRAAVQLALETLETLPTFEVSSATTPSVYNIMDHQCTYSGTALSMGVCYSHNLESTKTKLVHKNALKEKELLQKSLKALESRDFACSADAIIEMEKFKAQHDKKMKYHTCEITIQEKQIKRPGRPSKNVDSNTVRTVFNLVTRLETDEVRIAQDIKRECIFVVVSTDTSLSGIDILKEYKSQSSVERKFQFLKSPQFVNSLYVDTPSRAEALGYLMLILLVILSVAEYVVRRELAKENATIIGPGKKIMTRPSLMAIFRMFYSVQTASVSINGTVHRGYSEALRDNVSTVMRYLGLSENLFTRGPS